MSNPASTNAILLYVAAKGYLQAAKMIHLSPLKTVDRAEAVFLPFSMLLGFSLELYLRSWLCQSGHTLEELKRKPFGHDLKALLAATNSSQITAIQGLDSLVDILHGPHSQFEYRYMQPEVTYKVMKPEWAFGVFDALNIVVDTMIGASASKGLAPGY